ncbi:hypothetical protein, partial [Prevotella koreensis]|uniref:hypothetical protein n=1 Tax=Prevotella koreensis TaxID=2490854 RepID=UPI003F9ECD54
MYREFLYDGQYQIVAPYLLFNIQLITPPEYDRILFRSKAKKERSTLNAHHSTLNAQRSSLNAQRSTLIT